MSDPSTAVTALSREVAAVVVVAPRWCGPCRPAPTVLRELSRRWGGAVHAVIVEDLPDDRLDTLGIDAVPAWLRLAATDTAAHSADAALGQSAADSDPGPTADDTAPGPTESVAVARVITDLRGTAPHGGEVLLPGLWQVVQYRAGALPKHVVDATFGPDSS